MTGSSASEPTPPDHGHATAARGSVVAPAGVLTALAAELGAAVARHESLREWQMSAVERVWLDDGATVILKSAAEPFDREDRILDHAAAHGIPVPRVLARSSRPGWLAMLLEDLGDPPAQDAPLEEGARLAVAVHTCPPLGGLPRLDASELAELPGRALASLAELRAAGRWADADDIHASLTRLAAVAQDRAAGAEIPPFGMCHSEFHPTSIHVGRDGPRVLDWARAFTGPGLLDLASWEDTPKPLDTGKIRAMIAAYIDAGGAGTAATERSGLPAEVWAGGWHRVWISEWYLQQSVRWMPDPADDPDTQRAVHRHLAEATACLT